MSNPGALKSLLLMLQESPTLADASVVFGEEMIIAQDQALPMVVIVPRDGTWQMPGYYLNADPNANNQWMTQENVDIYMWAASTDPAAVPVDHADAVEQLRAQVLQALQNQQPYGLMYRPTNGRWVPAQDEVNRYGRAYILTVNVDISVPDVQPVDATVTSTTLTASFT